MRKLFVLQPEDCSDEGDGNYQTEKCSEFVYVHEFIRCVYLLIREAIAFCNALDLRAMRDLCRSGHRTELIFRSGCHQLQFGGKGQVVGWNFSLDEGCYCTVLVGQLTKRFGSEHIAQILAKLHHFQIAGTCRRSGCAKKRDHNQRRNAFLIVHNLISRSGEKNKSAQNDITDYPNCCDHTCPNCCADRRACLISIGLTLDAFAHRSPVADQPNNHRKIEQNESPLKKSAKKSPPRFFQSDAATRTFGGLIANVCATLFTRNYCHKYSLQNISIKTQTVVCETKRVNTRKLVQRCWVGGCIVRHERVGPCVLNTQRTTQLLFGFARRQLLDLPLLGLGGQSKGNNQNMAQECQRLVYGWLSGCGKTDRVEVAA